MSRQLFLLFLGWSFLSSFFWGEEEKDVEQIAKEAEVAFHNKDLLQAQELFKLVLKKGSPSDTGAHLISWPHLIDYAMKLARTCELLGQVEEGVKVLSDLLDKNPPTPLTPKVLLMRARLSAPQSSPEKSYLLFRAISKQLPMEYWSKEDLSFFHALSYSLDDYFDTQLRRAKRYFVTGFFEEAIALYEEVLGAIEHESFPKAALNRDLLEKKIKYALAECYFSQADYEKSLACVEKELAGGGKIEREMLYLMALCYKHKQEYEKAIACLQDYAQSGNKEELGHYDHALFEIGFYYYKHNQYSKARHYFEQLHHLPNNRGKPKLIAGLYLARIAIEQGETTLATKILATLTSTIPSSDPLTKELFFLKGEVAYLQGDYHQAKAAYEHARPTADGAGWHAQAFYKLGWSCLKIASNPTESKVLCEQLFDQAETIFKQQLTNEEPSHAVLSLARLYLLRKDRLGDLSTLSLIDPLIARYAHHLSSHQHHEALLLRAEGSVDSTKKHQLLQEATDPMYKGFPTYANAWYEKGLHEFQIGVRHNQGSFDEAIFAFQQALEHCQATDEKLAAKILKLEAKANLYRHSPLASLKLLEQLLSQYIENGQEREETLYLRGLIASQLTDPIYFSIAEDSLKQVLSLYPQGNYYADALNILGTLYFQRGTFDLAQSMFLKLAQCPSPLAPNGWFWAAESLSRMNPTDPDITLYRQQVYTLYPTSDQAPEAYFRCYPYSDYVDGKGEALNHLAQFSEHFPTSPLRLMVHYLLGMHVAEKEEAVLALQEAVRLLPQLTAEGNLPDKNMIHFYYESLHRLAILYLEEDKNREKGLVLLRQILDDFSEPGHPLMTQLKQTGKIPMEYAQAAYTLAKAYLDGGQRTKAEQTFFGLLTQFREAAITDHIYLSMSWREQAKLAMGDHDYETAMNCLDVAEEAGRWSLSDEQKLRLWLIKSDCCRQLGDLEKAMRLLSKVINADVVSPLRIQAMFTRAEIYEQQGRPELAVRQLEALVKKGGEWGDLAQLRLRKFAS